MPNKGVTQSPRCVAIFFCALGKKGEIGEGEEGCAEHKRMVLGLGGEKVSYQHM